ncbi:transposase family protein [Nonomuraea sp. NPDC050153]|uniref:transposase family protein n=1 Tax=Nonomuraea sp. NPDC050153 TaxID=3364359 RepID=UPI0037BD4BA4
MACNGCGRPPMRVHDRYRRRLHDLSCAGRPVRVELEVRRFICDNSACSVATFAEQVAGLTAQECGRTAADLPAARRAPPTRGNDRLVACPSTARPCGISPRTPGEGADSADPGRRRTPPAVSSDCTHLPPELTRMGHE